MGSLAPKCAGLPPESLSVMPFSDRHQKQKTKNLALLAILIALMLAFYILTLVKFSPVS